MNKKIIILFIILILISTYFTIFNTFYKTKSTTPLLNIKNETLTIDKVYNRITGKIDFSNRFWNYENFDFITHFKVDDIIEAKYSEAGKFDIKDTFSDFIYTGFEQDLKVLAEVISIKNNKITLDKLNQQCYYLFVNKNY